MPQLPFNHNALQEQPLIEGLARLIQTNIGTLEAYDPAKYTGRAELHRSVVSDLHGAAEGLRILVGSGLSAKPELRRFVADLLRPVFEAVAQDPAYPEIVRSEAQAGLQTSQDYDLRAA